MGWSVVHVLGEPARPLGQVARHQADEGVDVEALLGGQHDHVVEVAELLHRLVLRPGLVLVNQVGLGDDEHLEGARLVDVLGHPLVTAAGGRRAVDEHGDHVHVLQGVERRDVELLAQRVDRLVQAGGVHQDHLHGGGVVDRADAMPGGLRRRGGDDDLLSDDGVDQRRLAGVGTADQGHEAAPEGGVSLVGGLVVELVVKVVQVIVIEVRRRGEPLVQLVAALLAKVGGVAVNGGVARGDGSLDGLVGILDGGVGHGWSFLSRVGDQRNVAHGVSRH